MVVLRLNEDIFMKYCLISDTCPPLKPMRKGSLVQVGTELGAVGTYKCNIGFELLGSPKRTCQPNGKWSGQKPKCRGKVAENSQY